MKSLTGLCIILLLATSATFAQSKLYTKAGNISFKSKTAIQDIEALNTKVLSVWETNSGNIEFSLLIKGFQFEKALMQEHFNENYMESDKYPKALFKGVVENSKNISLTTDNIINTKVNGMLTMHGITREISIPAVIKIKNKEVSATTSFAVFLEDYNIKIPAVVAEKISKKINIQINIPAYKQLTTK